MIRNCAASPSSWPGAAIARSYARLRTKPGLSACVQPCRQHVQSACVQMRPSSLLISRVIQPEDVDAFLLPLAVGRLPGVGKVTQEKLAKLQIQTVGKLRGMELSMLEHGFGRYGVRLHELARGIDDSEVIPNRPPQSISV